MSPSPADPPSEDRLLAWLRRRLARAGGEPLLGDDAAFLPAGGPWAATVDSQIAGVHYPPDLDPAVVARRLLAVNLSDLAAVGAEPAYALLALTAPAGFDHRRFFRGFTAACRAQGVTLAGGDLARCPRAAGAAMATLTLIGRRPAGGRWLRRGAALPGDVIWLGGTVGESAAGRLLVAAGARPAGSAGRRIELPAGLAPSSLARAAARAVRRHLLPVPQLALGAALGRRRRVAAIDLSDGLALDLERLARESGVGALLEAKRLPLPRGFAALAARLRADPLALALGGGEDYVLLFTLPAAATPPAGFPCHAIGAVTRRRALRWRRDGAEEPLPHLGWDHLQTGA
jgi:thiamine-monophosphate kinase